jgi:class 3 adenylate cyclase/predicted component of type VI protein secretion system
MTRPANNGADLERENAELRRQLDESLAQQTATAEVLGVINASPGDLVPVFDAMLERALSLCNVEFGGLWTYDGSQANPAVLRGVPPAMAEFYQTPIRDTPGGWIYSLASGAEFVHVPDITADEAYRDRPGRRALVELGGFRSTLMVPLRKDGPLLGLICLCDMQARAFTDKQIALLQNFAAQAVIAMENARLLTETREALEQQTATAEVLQVINSSPGDLAPVFEAMLERALRLGEAAFGTLRIFDGEYFHLAASRGASPALQVFQREPLAPGPGHRRMLAGENVVQIADIIEGEPYRSGAPAQRALVELGGARSYLSIALRKEQALLGYMSFYRPEVRPFTDKQIALLQSFAAQAVIAMENARLLTETREALDQQTATTEVLQVINSSPGDLAPVFDAMLEKAMRLCEAAFGILATYDGGQFRTAAVQGIPAAFAKFRGQNRPSFGPGTGPARILAGERVIHDIDLMAEEAYQNGDPNRRALVDLGGARSALQVALLKDDAVLGYITAYRQEVRSFTDKQIALLQNFAAQAVIAMENARLLGELRARTDEVAGLNRDLEARVAAQLGELERAGRLKRFLAPQLADLIVARGDESILESHRREIVVVFCDLRGFTAFAERAEPEEVMALLRDYHAALGPIVASFEGTLDHYAGDGIMVFFNDPLPTPDPAKRAIEMAVAMRAAVQRVLNAWRRHGHDIGFGLGISQGYATLGQIGFAERMDYTAIGTVTNLAARLCGEAKDGQILVSRRVAVAVEDAATLEEIGDLSLKGLSQAVAVYNVGGAA